VSTGGWCRTVSGATNLSLTGPGEVATYIEAPPRAIGRKAERAIMMPPFIGASDKEIAARVRKIVTKILVDRSGSMDCGSWGGDPTDVCGAAGESVFGLLRRSGGGLVTIIPWGSDAPPERITGPLDVRRNFRTLRTAMRDRAGLGGTNLFAGLARAAEIQPTLAPDEIPLTLIFSDGIQDVSPAVHAAVAALPPSSVHMCLIDRFNGCTPDLEAAWQSVPFASFTRLDVLDVRNLAIQIAEIYAGATDLSVGTTTPPSKSPTSRKKK
jgi:hypothetical protein